MDYDPNTNPFDLHFSGKLPKREVSASASKVVEKKWLVKDEVSSFIEHFGVQYFDLKIFDYE
jgi:hypothetical protein